MASGSVASPSAKARGNNRSLSGTFGSSTIGTIIFISLCIMGGYMLTTNSVRFPPSSTWTPINMANKMATQLSSTPLIPKRKSMEGKDSQFDDDSQSNSAEMDGSGDSGDNNPSQDTGNGNDAETNQNDEQESAKDDSVDSNQGDAQAENVQSDEDQRERSDEQRQEEEQSEGATSDAQTQHDEASVNEQQTDSQENQDGQNDQETSNEEQPPKEAKETKESWSTQATESTNQKEQEKTNANNEDTTTWELCNVQAGRDYIPCLDNEEAIAKLKGRNHYEHRERHCPEVPPTCLVPLPEGYKTPIEWPKSRDKVWYKNVPTTKLAEYKGHQNWVKVTGEYMTFPGGGTQFVNGANHYLDFIQQAMRTIAWGKHTRVVLDVGCGVASFGGFLFDRDVLTMSLAPKDEHEAQVQFALERGIPAISAVMGTQRLPFPSKVFDLVHCARCRVPWHIEGGALLLELNRVLRPGGFFVWSATPVYRTDEESVQIWKDMSTLTMAMCWELVSTKKDTINKVGAAIYRKPVSNKCYANRQNKEPPICNSGDDPNAAWYVPLQACMHEIPTRRSERGSKWPEDWPARLETVPYWLDSSQTGVYGKPAPEDFTADYEFWKQIINKSYLNGLGISWSNVRNVMDMRAVYGGFAAVLKDMKLWVMNVVNIDAPDTLPIIYERGLFGIYHDWCESFSTYPRSYDLLHAHHLFSNLKKRCKILPVIVEIDRIVRPGGKLVVRDEMSVIEEVEKTLRSLHWEIRMSFFMNKQGMLSAQKTDWRPESS